jgi:hypothetical protein
MKRSAVRGALVVNRFGAPPRPDPQTGFVELTAAVAKS